MENELLKDLVVVFALAIVTVVVLRRVGVPSIAGFILAGMFVGPHVLGVVGDAHEVEVLADIGVALLLFGIGLELSLDRVRRLWRLILKAGSIQVVVTTAAVTLGLWLSSYSVNTAVFFGCVVAVSSTAVVLSALRARGDLDSPHGRLTLGILIFQDLCVVPMILMIPLLSGSAPPGTLAIAVAKSAVVLVAVLVGARYLVPRLLNLVARTRQRDVFVLSVFLVCIGTAWLVSAAGVSLALTMVASLPMSSRNALSATSEPIASPSGLTWAVMRNDSYVRMNFWTLSHIFPHHFFLRSLYARFFASPTFRNSGVSATMALYSSRASLYSRLSSSMRARS